MQCTVCKRELVSLFLTQVCDYCDYGVPKEQLHRGVIVYHSDSHTPLNEFVFRTSIDADRWRTAAGREGCDLYAVYSLLPFRWHLSRGTLRNVVLADHSFEVFDTWRYESLPYRCFLGAKLTGPLATEEADDDVPF